MARFTTCFSTLLVGKKKKSSKESSKSINAKRTNSNEKLKVKPEELFLPLSPSPTGTGTGTGAADEKPVPNAYVILERLETTLEVEEEELPISPKRNSPDPLTPNESTRVSSPTLLKRSCSNIERKTPNRINTPIKKPYSYDDLKNLTDRDFVKESKPDSPLSIKSSFSADKVILKKRSSSQVLPSRSRKLWWRLFMWSHRNLHRPYWISNKEEFEAQFDNNNKGGYSSDTLEIMDEKKKKKMDDEENNEWVAFSTEGSYFDRINAWINSIPNDNNDNNNNDDNNNINDDEDEEDDENDEVFFGEIGESSGKDQKENSFKNKGEIEMLQANNVIQNMNIFSNVAHIAGMGLKVVPLISTFTCLKTVNLSNNFIVNITSGALPKSLHTLNLSRNKIGSIEGLRELTRLRVLDLSYNKISRIGHGLSNCTAIKELYLAGNKISNVEGLHRLLKLTVLDLSFNKITTTKSLGQLVANYNSLLALNILANPIQTNIGDDQLKKSMSSLLPRLTYLNKQLVTKGREVTSDRVAKAALGNGQWGAGSSRRKLTRRSSQGSGSGSGSYRGRNDKGKNRYRK